MVRELQDELLARCALKRVLEQIKKCGFVFELKLDLKPGEVERSYGLLKMTGTVNTILLGRDEDIRTV